MSCTVLVFATPMAFSSVLSCSLYDQILRRASERSLLHSPATAPVWNVLSLVGTELFPGGVETLVFVYLKAYLCKPKPCVRTVEKLTRL